MTPSALSVLQQVLQAERTAAAEDQTVRRVNEPPVSAHLPPVFISCLRRSPEPRQQLAERHVVEASAGTQVLLQKVPFVVSPGA